MRIGEESYCISILSFPSASASSFDHHSSSRVPATCALFALELGSFVFHSTSMTTRVHNLGNVKRNKLGQLRYVHSTGKRITMLGKAACRLVF
jgi:hypothetical protein